MARKTKSNYNMRTDGPFILITDENRGNMSVTNNVEEVIEAIQEQLGDDNPIDDFHIIYKDSMGVVDGIKTSNGKFAGFIHIGAKNFDDAKDKVLKDEK